MRHLCESRAGLCDALIKADRDGHLPPYSPINDAIVTIFIGLEADSKNVIKYRKSSIDRSIDGTRYSITFFSSIPMPTAI